MTERRQEKRRQGRERRGSNWLALLLLTFRSSRPPCRRNGWDRRARYEVVITSMPTCPAEIEATEPEPAEAEA